MGLFEDADGLRRKTTRRLSVWVENTPGRHHTGNLPNLAAVDGKDRMQEMEATLLGFLLLEGMRVDGMRL